MPITPPTEHQHTWFDGWRGGLMNERSAEWFADLAEPMRQVLGYGTSSIAITVVEKNGRIHSVQYHVACATDKAEVILSEARARLLPPIYIEHLLWQAVDKVLP